MAAATGDSSYKDSQGCPICLDALTSPRQLPCLHSFCEHCLQDYITKKAKATSGKFDNFLCPICRAITRPEKKDKSIEEWASVFPKSPISMMVESKVKVERLCDICSSRKSSNIAKTVCLVCEEAMCDDCSFAHQTMKMTRNHKMVSVEDLEINPQYCMKFAKGFGCPSHQDKEIEFYCKIHEATCCATCSFLHHKTCKEVLELKINLTDLLKETNSQKIIQELIMLEGYLTKFTEINEKNIGILESQVNDLTAQICEIRKKINVILDDMEKRVKGEGNRIYKEEMIRNQEQNYECQSLINAIRNSYALLETVNSLGTDTQKFLVTRQTMKQLPSYRGQIQEKFERIDSIEIMLELNSHLKSALSQDGKQLVKIVCKDRSEIMQCKCSLGPLQERMVQLSRVINIDCPIGEDPCYTGVAQLQGGDMLLADFNNSTCCLYDASYNFHTMYSLPGRPYDMCLTDDNEVVVTMPLNNLIQFLFIKDRSIEQAVPLSTIVPYDGVATVSKREIVLSGHCDYLGSTKCYWSLYTKDGMMLKFSYEFDCESTHLTYISVNTSMSRVYISVGVGHAVYCFGLRDGISYFAYTANDLKKPLGIAVDIENNVYIVGNASHNIHKLSSDGSLLQVISSGVPNKPSKILFDVNRDQFILTNDGTERKILHCFMHK